MAWLSGWTKRVKISIDNGDIGSALTDFPITIYLSASSGINSEDVSFIFDELGSNDNRKKIAVTKDDGTTQCYVEIERWDHDNEKAWLHVKVPSISSSVDTGLYLYYDSTKSDNTTYIGDSGERTEVWNSNYKAVLHLTENGGIKITDWKSPGTCANIDRIGGAAWSNPDNVKASDNNDAIVAISGVDNSDWLRCTNFGFTSSDIPSGMSIVGIEMKIEHRASAPSDTWDSALYLRKTSGQVGDNKADPTVWTTTEATFTYGESTDTWNAGLVYADIVNNSDFGLDFSAHNDYVETEDAEVDHVQMRIYYKNIQSTEWKSPGTITNIDNAGGIAWTNPGNAAASDDSKAVCTGMNYGINSDWLRCTNFGFTSDDIPAGKTIVGIEMKMERCESEVNDIYDDDIFLRKTSGQIGDDKAIADYWSDNGVDEIITYGGMSDTWNAGLVYADIVSNSNFGIDIAAICRAPLSVPRDGSIDHVQIKIYYSDPITTGKDIIDSTSNNNDGASHGGPVLIDVGGDETGTPDVTASNTTNAYIVYENVSNDGGYITELRMNIDTVGNGDLRIFTASKDGNDYTVRDFVNLTITDTGSQTHYINLEIQTGDYLGFWADTVRVERESSGSIKYYYVVTITVPSVDYVYTMALGSNSYEIKMRAEFRPMPSSSLVDTQIGKGLRFDEIDDYFVISDFDYNDTFTFTVWSKIPDNSGTYWKYILSHDVYTTNPCFALLFGEDSCSTTADRNETIGRLYDNSSSDEYLRTDQPGDIDATDGNWHKITFIRVRNGTTRLRIDGQEQDTYSSPDTDVDPEGPIYIGIRNNLDSNRFFGGDLDEIMISNVDRGDDWDIAEYESQRDHLLDYGSEEIFQNAIFFGCNF